MLSVCILVGGYNRSMTLSWTMKERNAGTTSDL